MINSSKFFAAFSFIILGLFFSNSLVGQNNEEISIMKKNPPVEFNADEIEKIKTVVEAHLKTRISDAEFSDYGKATEKNLAMFKKMDETQKENPFFSQPHISFVIQNMETRLGLRKPNYIPGERKKRRPIRTSKLPKGKRDSDNN